MPADYHTAAERAVKRGSVLASAALGAALTPLNSTMVAVALPALSMEFASPAATVTLFVVTGYLVATIVSQLPAGSVADRVGYARALTWGRLLFGGGAAVGPALGAFMTAHFGWRSLFVINVPLLLLSWLLQPRVEDDHQAVRRREFSYLSLLRNPGFMAGAGVVSTQNLAMYSLLVQVPFLFGGSDGTDAGLGLAIIAMTLTMAATSPLGGWLVEWVGVKVVVAAGGLLGAAGVAALSALPAAASAREVGTRLLLVGLGLGLSTGPANAVALTAVPQEQSAMASATMAMLRYFGAIAGTLILSAAFGTGEAAGARQHLALWIFVAALIVSAGLGATLPALPGQRYFRRSASAN